MRLRNTLLTGGASYIQLVTLMVTQLVSIPLALRFLSHEQFGLWSFTSQSLGYLLLLDLGVTNSVGRLMAEPLYNDPHEEHWNGWYNLFLIILVAQATLILVLGWLLVEPILHWFRIPPALHAEARALWIMMLCINVVAFPFRVYPGLLGAQNRSYWSTLSSTLSMWVGLVAFYLFLKLGFNSLAYGFSSLASMVVGTQLSLWAVMKGPHRFRLTVHQLPWAQIRSVFGFSSAIFVIGIAVQIAFLSQSLIIARLIGLSAVASFTVCSRLPMLLMQLIWKPFDAFTPLWQIHWVRNEVPVIRKELKKGLSLTIGLSIATTTSCLAANRWFVYLFAHEALYQGKWFDFFFSLFVIAQVWNHCLSYIFVLTKQLHRFAGVLCLDILIGLTACIFFTHKFGLIGYIAGASLYTVVSIGFWYNTIMGPKALGIEFYEILRQEWRGWTLLISLLFAGALLSIIAYDNHAPELWWIELLLFIAAPLAFLGLYRQDLIGYYRTLRSERSTP